MSGEADAGHGPSRRTPDAEAGHGPSNGTPDADVRATEPRTFHLDVLRSARVWTLGGEGSEEGRPGARLPTGPRPASTWFVLHGYRQLARRFLRRFAGVAGPARRIVAPEGLSRFYLAPGDRPHGASDPVGASWMTREDREVEIRDYVRYLDRVARTVGAWTRDPEGDRSSQGRITVLGFSQGAHTAARWVALGGIRPHRLVLWGAGLPGDLPPEAGERFRAVEVIVVRGASDRLRQAAEEAREARLLDEWEVRWREIPHLGGHEIEPEVLAALIEGE